MGNGAESLLLVIDAMQLQAMVVSVVVTSCSETF